MHRNRAFLFTLLLSILSCSTAHSEKPDDLGFGFGREFRKNNDISQFEITWRHSLPYAKHRADWKLATTLEFGAAVIDENGPGGISTGRFSLMPQFHVGRSGIINLIIGIGPGLMVGETAFTNQNLGGPFFLSSKLGLQVLLGDGWAVEYIFYHQSNAGIYDYNASLNIHHLAVTVRF